MLIASAGISITGKFFATLAFHIIYIVTAELFPRVAMFAMILLIVSEQQNCTNDR